MNTGVQILGAIEARQIRAARAMLGMSQMELCAAASISRATLIDMENDTGDPRRSSYVSVQKAFLALGVVFTESENGIGLTVPRRQRKVKAASKRPPAE